MFDFRTKLAGLLTAAGKRLERRPRDETASSRFVDLAPTDNADADAPELEDEELNDDTDDWDK